MSDRVVVAMSGGVDSSAAAVLMKKRGFEVIGLTMQLGSCDSRCCSDRDVLDARRVSKVLQIPHYVVSFKKSFRRDVIDYFIEEYVRGRTPNPCAVCNPKIKFGVLLDKARSLGASALVTGHYAYIEQDPDTGRWLLKRGKERSKDQSYFLSRLSQDQLSHAIFPVGSYRKTQIRRIAERADLPVAYKNDSQEVCFIPDSGVADFIEKEHPVPLQPGRIIDTKGNTLGDHSGITGYTIGQRKGLGIAVGRPVYVTRIDAASNTVTVGDDRDLFHNTLIASDPNWICIPSLKEKLQVRTRIRYRHQPARSIIELMDDGRIRIQFNTPQRAITPGQLAVFYQDERVLGSAWIDGVAG